MEPAGQRLTDEKLSYLAGYMDADGCVMFSATPRVAVTSIFAPVLELFREAFGGSIRKLKGDNRAVWQWEASGNRAMRCLVRLVPFMFEKQAQARIAMEARGTKPGPHRDGLVAQLAALKRVDYQPKETA